MKHKKLIRKTKKVKRAKKIKRKVHRAIKKIVKAKPKTKEAAKVIHFYDKIKVGVLKLKKPLALGDEIEIEGHGKKFKQKLTSMQVNRKPLKKAKAGQEVAIKVIKEVKKGDLVYKL